MADPLDEFGPVHIVKRRKRRAQKREYKRGPHLVRLMIYRRLAAEGFTQSQAAKQLGVTVAAVSLMGKRWGLVFAKPINWKQAAPTACVPNQSTAEQLLHAPLVARSL